MWARMALKSGHMKTARVHAAAAWVRTPLSFRSVGLLIACSIGPRLGRHSSRCGVESRASSRLWVSQDNRLSDQKGCAATEREGKPDA